MTEPVFIPAPVAEAEEPAVEETVTDDAWEYDPYDDYDYEYGDFYDEDDDSMCECGCGD